MKSEVKVVEEESMLTVFPSVTCVSVLPLYGLTVMSVSFNCASVNCVSVKCASVNCDCL